MAFIPGRFKLLEITLDHLHAVAGGTRRDQQRDDKHQRVQVITQDAEEAEAPDGLRDRANERQQHAIEAAEVNDQRTENEDEGDRENFRQLAGIEPHPALQHRLARGVQHGVVVLHVLANENDLMLDVTVVQPLFVEARQDQGGLAVGRQIFSIDDVVVVHRLLEFFEFNRVGGNLLGQDRHRLDQATRARLQTTDLDVRQRGHLVVIDAVDLVNLLGDVADFLQRVGVEDVAIFHPQRKADDVSAAESGAKMVIGLDVRMRLRQQVRELTVHLHLHRVEREEDRDDCQCRQRGPAMLQGESGDAVGDTFRCRQSAHGSCH